MNIQGNGSTHARQGTAGSLDFVDHTFGTTRNDSYTADTLGLRYSHCFTNNARNVGTSLDDIGTAVKILVIGFCNLHFRLESTRLVRRGHLIVLTKFGRQCIQVKLIIGGNRGKDIHQIRVADYPSKAQVSQFTPLFRFVE